MFEKYKSRKLKEKEKEEILNYVAKKMEKIILFPGNVTEYEKFKGYEVEILDTGQTDKSIYPFDCCFKENKGLNLYKKMLDSGLEAIVNLRYKTFPSKDEKCPGRSELYGLPVKKAQK